MGFFFTRFQKQVPQRSVINIQSKLQIPYMRRGFSKSKKRGGKILNIAHRRVLKSNVISSRHMLLLEEITKMT